MSEELSRLTTHEDLKVWQDSIELAKEIYTVTNQFPESEKFGLISQMRRAVVSIPSNIAEGAARNSKKEFIQFLYIALGSIAELETQIILAYEFGYLNSKSNEILIRIKRMVIGLIKSLKK
ncbi:MAG: four helix bundle protein [Nitrospinae bacterium]|nr:four helix bundle protein [Nitrospinota bacterium]